jgi:hypothetical protein
MSNNTNHMVHSYAEYTLLIELHSLRLQKQPAPTQKELAERVGYSAAYVSQTIKYSDYMDRENGKVVILTLLGDTPFIYKGSRMESSYRGPGRENRLTTLDAECCVEAATP